MGVSEVFIQEPQVPFKRAIRPSHGQLYVIVAGSPTNAKRFAVNFYAKGEQGDTALHIDNRFNEKVAVRNTRRNGAWESEERTGGRLPLVTGRNFEMMVLAREDGFMIAYNGNHFAEYKHRVPLAEIDTIQVTGDVKISSFRESRPPMDFMESLANPSPTNSVRLNVNEKDRNFKIKGGLRNDQILHICGVPGENIFNFDFYPHDKSTEIGLHLSCRVKEDAVVINNRLNMKWQTELRPPNFKVVQGQHFDLEITAQDQNFRLLLNGSTLAVLPKRHIMPDVLSFLKVEGDVTLILVELVPVDSAI